MSHEPRLVEVRKNVLKQNDVVARALRQRFREAGVFVVSLVSSPGAGKTTLLEQTLTLLHAAATASPRWSATWPPRTTRRGSRAAGRRCEQITTGTRLPPRGRDGRAGRSRAGRSTELDFLFIENVGNLVCPASYDLGERPALRRCSRSPRARTSRSSIPTIFNTADVALDHQDRPRRRRRLRLAGARSPASRRCARAWRSLGVSATTGQGMDRVSRAARAAPG